jgi:5-methylcytosine-specific restriction enzyme A
MFILGEKYPRATLLAFVGSKQSQSGIIWGPLRGDCVIITSGGRHSKEAGYHDERKTDGSWIYFGQGENGDQDPSKYSNKLLIEGQRSVILFSTKEPTPEQIKERGDFSKRYRYEGVFNVLTWDIFIPDSGKRAGNKLLQFVLVPFEDNYSLVNPKLEDTHVVEENLSAIRTIALNQGNIPVQPKRSLQQYRQASRLIKKYARLRASGICEWCDQPAPFFGTFGEPFLEVHYIFRLADDGPDSVVNVAAICPNCHREAHFGENLENLRQMLAKKIQEKEESLAKST